VKGEEIYGSILFADHLRRLRDREDRPFYSADARDRRALEVHKTLDSVDSLFWLDLKHKKMSAGSYPAMFFEEGESHEERI